MDQSIDVPSFIQRKKSLCGKLIEYGIWKGIDSNDLNAWLKNFSTELLSIRRKNNDKCNSNYTSL